MSAAATSSATTSTRTTQADRATERPDPAVHAGALIQQATDPRNGTVNTRQLGQWVADAARQNPSAASQAHAAIETRLLASSPADAASFNSEVVSAAQALVPSGLAGAGQGLVQSGTRLLVDNPILTKRWEPTTSAWTGRGGFTGPLKELFDKSGIDFLDRPHPSPAGSLSRSAGVPPAIANNTNGSLARDAIAARYATLPNAVVSTEQPRNGGARVVDVVVDLPAQDPRMSQRIEIESKVGRTGQSSTTRGQVAQDVKTLADNRMLRGSGVVLENVGKVARPVGVVLDAVSIGQAFHADGNRIGENTGRTASGVAGGALGGWGGAVGGAAIGTAIFPGVGTVVGGLVGGAIGAFAGDQAGKGLFDTVKGWF